MALPRINIAYLNGRLGTVAKNEDGLLVLCAKGAAVSGKLDTDRAYKIYRLSGLADLGVTESSHGALYKAVRQFYTEAPEGTPLYVVVYSDDSMETFCDKDSGSLRGILQCLKGAARGVVVLHPDSAEENLNGLSDRVFDTITNAQILGDWAATELYAPVFFLLDGYNFSDAESLMDLSGAEYNRVMVAIGSDSPAELHAAVGYLAGRIARIPVQRNIGRVKDGGIAAGQMFIGTKAVENAMDDIETIYAKGYVTPRVHVGRAGYYYTDDILACKVTDDYAHLTARRTIDKVVRIAYDALLNNLLDEVELNDDGTMQDPVLKAWQADVEKAVNMSMTAAGELASVDGSGCECTIDPSQNVRATSTVEVIVAARPFGYPRTIVAKLGFKVEE